VLGSLKKVLKCWKFESDKDVKTVVKQWFQQQPREFFVEGIHRLVHQWDACLITHGDYF
jgi:phage terminase large subunit-like protein